MKNKETLEEAAEKYATDMSGAYYEDLSNSFKKGAKWQQERMYSEEEVLKMLEYAVHESRMQDDKTEEYIVNETIFEFKKK